MGITTTMTFPFYGGTGGSSLVPGVFPVALAGRPYGLDLKSDQMRHISIPLLRQQADDSSSPSEASLNPDDLWRRAQDSWHHGAGQTFRDREDGNPNRFRSSKGIDGWTKYQFSLLPATDQKKASVNTNLAVMPAGARLYNVDGATLEFTTDITAGTPTMTAVTYAGGTITSIASDGFHVWVTDGSNIYETDTGVTTSAVHDTLDADLLAYVKGRLMAAHDNSIYDNTLGSTPDALFSHGNEAFRWVGFADGRAAIYAAGFSGDKSLIYRITIKPDASGLDQPVIAGELPDGEIVRSIYGYLGFIFIGTDKGWRFALADGQANLEIGALIETSAAVRCFEGQESFVWFGMSNYDSVSTGLGRADLRVITDPAALTLAYASDLMVTEQADVLSVATFQDIRVFTVSAEGVYAQDTLKVASGSIDSGLIGYGLPDLKTGLFVDVRTEPLAGSYAVSLAADNGAFADVGSESAADDTGTQFPLNETTGERFELRLTLARDATATTTGPEVTRWTLKSNPRAELREFIIVPLLLHNVVKVSGRPYPYDVQFELDAIKGLRETRQLIAYQEGVQTYSVSVEDYEWVPYEPTKNGAAFNGTLNTKLKKLS